jgi:hypothetical protein
MGLRMLLGVGRGECFGAPSEHRRGAGARRGILASQLICLAHVDHIRGLYGDDLGVTVATHDRGNDRDAILNLALPSVSRVQHIAVPMPNPDLPVATRQSAWSRHVIASNQRRQHPIRP